MTVIQLDRASWSVGPFSASPVLLSGLRMAGVTVHELVAQTPFGMGTIDVAAADPLGLRLRVAFPEGTVISRRGTSFDVGTTVMNSHRYIEADGLPLVEMHGATIPETLLGALPGRELSCLIVSTLLPLREVDPLIATAGLIRRSKGLVLSVVLDMNWVAAA